MSSWTDFFLIPFNISFERTKNMLQIRSVYAAYERAVATRSEILNEINEIIKKKDSDKI